MSTKKTKKETLSAKAIRLLRKVEAHILEEPKRYNQNTVCEIYSPARIKQRKGWGGDVSFIPPCGTVACIGGWVNVLSGHRRSKNLDLAKKTLGLTEEQSDRLFAGICYEPEFDCVELGDTSRQWPERFQVAYFKARTAAGRARVAVRRIEHFIKTGGAE